MKRPPLSSTLRRALSALCAGLLASSLACAQAGKDIVVGFANAKSGWVEA